MKTSKHEIITHQYTEILVSELIWQRAVLRHFLLELLKDFMRVHDVTFRLSTAIEFLIE